MLKALEQLVGVKILESIARNPKEGMHRIMQNYAGMMFFTQLKGLDHKNVSPDVIAINERYFEKFMDLVEEYFLAIYGDASPVFNREAIMKDFREASKEVDELISKVKEEDKKDGSV